MTRGGVKEYIEAVRGRYLKGNRKVKGQILDEVTQVTGYHRLAVIRLLTRGPKTEAGRRGRPKQYGIEVVAALKRVWETGDRMCSRRLQPFLPELVQVLERHGELTLADEVKEQLCRMSVATIDRVLKPYRKRGLRRPFSTTKPGSLLKASIPIRTFADWDDKRPGFLEIDLVAHCGESTEGFYLNTLSTVDVATGWVEVRGVWGKGQQRVGGAIHQVGKQLPFPLLGLDSDNGSEFINHNLLLIASGRGSPLPGPGPTRRMTPPMWSRRTGRWSAVWWAMTATVPKRPWFSSTRCANWWETTSTSSSR